MFPLTIGVCVRRLCRVAVAGIALGLAPLAASAQLNSAPPMQPHEVLEDLSPDTLSRVAAAHLLRMPAAASSFVKASEINAQMASSQQPAAQVLTTAPVLVSGVAPQVSSSRFVQARSDVAP